MTGPTVPAEAATSDPTTERLAAIRSRLAAATPGPLDMETHDHHEAGCRCGSCHVTTGWRLDHPTWTCCDETPVMMKATSSAQVAGRKQESCYQAPIPYADVEFLARAHEDVTFLLAERDQALAEVERLRAALRGIRQALGPDTICACPAQDENCGLRVEAGEALRLASEALDAWP